MADLATLRARLAEAEEALHQLAIGDKASSASYGDTEVQFAVYASSPERLEQYIEKLKAQIRRLEGRRGRRVMRISI